MSQGGRHRSDEIEHEIRQARARLDDTLHQIEEKFSPEQLMNKTYDYLRHGGSERIATGLSRTIKENPLPVLVTGIGLGWLILAQRHTHQSASQEALPRRGGYPGATLPQASMDDGRTTASGAGTTTLGHDPAAMGATPQHGAGSHSDSEGMTDKAKHMIDEVRERAGHLGDEVKERSQHLGDRLRDGASHFDERRHAAMDTTSHRMHDAGSQATHFVEEHPLVVGALGLALGAVLGGVFSSTRVENRHLGEMRDRAIHRAEEMGEEQLNRAKEKVHETAQHVKEKARSGQSSNDAPSYVENPSSEERLSKAGGPGSGNAKSPAENSQTAAVKQGGSSAKPYGGTASPPKDN